MYKSIYIHIYTCVSYTDTSTCIYIYLSIYTYTQTYICAHRVYICTMYASITYMQIHMCQTRSLCKLLYRYFLVFQGMFKPITSFLLHNSV